MAELIATIILAASLLGMVIIFFRKIPVLVELPEVPVGPKLREKIRSLKERIRKWKYFKNLSSEILRQKTLSKIRVLTLKLENKVSNRLQKIREEAQRKKAGADNYWQELKKTAHWKKDKKKPS